MGHQREVKSERPRVVALLENPLVNRSGIPWQTLWRNLTFLARVGLVEEALFRFRSLQHNHEWGPVKGRQFLFDCVKRFISSDQFRTTWIWVGGES